MRNKPRKKSDVSKDKKYDIVDIDDPRKLPGHYIGMPDDVTYAIDRINWFESKLFLRGFKVPRPLRLFRLHTGQNVYPVGSHSQVKIIKRMKPFTMIAVEVEENGNQ